MVEEKAHQAMRKGPVAVTIVFSMLPKAVLKLLEGRHEQSAIDQLERNPPKLTEPA